MRTHFIVKSAMIAALYVVLTFVFSAFSFGAIQVRVAMGLELLSFFTPAGILGCAVGTLLSNILFGGLGLIDAVVGTLTTAICCGLVYASSFYRWHEETTMGSIEHDYWNVAWLIPIVPTAFLVDIILHLTLNVPFCITFITLSAGNAIAMFIGFIIFNMLRRNIELMKIIKK